MSCVTGDKVYQLLAHDRWFSPGTPASSTTKTDRHVIAEILLKVALKHQRSINLTELQVQQIGSFLHNFVQSNLPYVTFQGYSEIWSYKAGGCLIQV
jgi:hypothetical protein